jgi:CheY-like chemotaxis protein
VILDWERNGSDCLAVARAIRQIAPADKCPVIVMASTSAAAALKRETVEGVIDALLTKPVTASTLNNAAIAARRNRANAGVSLPVRVAAGAELAGLRILVVDDSDINRDVAQRILQEKGARVALAEDGQRAIAWLLAHPDTVDLVLMDVQMPVMDGIEATRQLRAMPRFANLPIVALTAGAFKSHHEAARAAGMTHFVTKPFDVPLTVDLIRQLTGRSGDDAAKDAGEEAQAVASPAPRLTVIDLARGVEIWGDVDTYQLYLRKFAASFASCGSDIRTRVVAGDLKGAASVAHKLAGAAANVALQDVAHLAMEAERQLAGHGDEGADHCHICATLEEALLAALADISQLAPLPHPQAPAPVVQPSANVLSHRVGPLLQRLLDALHLDNPGPSAPVLQELGRELPAEDVAVLASKIEEFDFRGAEQATQALARRLGLQLEAPGN